MASVGGVLLADEKGYSSPDRRSTVERVLVAYRLRACVDTLTACSPIEGFVVVAEPGSEHEARSAAEISSKFIAVVPGGATIRESVLAAVEALPPVLDRVLVHHMAWPLARPDLMETILEPLAGADAVVPAFPVVETVKRVEDGLVLQTVPRGDLSTLQMPQAFRREALADTHRGGSGPQRPALAVQAAGLRVVAVSGDPANMRAVDPDDVRRVVNLLAARQAKADGR